MRITIAGDFCPRWRISQKIEAGSFDFLDEIRALLEEDDYSIVNWECPIISDGFKPIDKTGPNLGCAEKAIDSIVQAGFDCVTLANNHFRDYGQDGVEKTINVCKNRGIDYCGGGKDIQEANQILFKTIKGERLAIINICENEWSIATEHRGGSAPLDILANFKVIQEAKEKADYVVMIVHGGVEFYKLPTPRMKKAYHFFIDCGVDAIVNHHQHCFSGYEIYKEKPIIYGLGNFCFDKKNAPVNWCYGYMVQLNLAKKTIKFDLIPYEQCTSQNAEVKILHDNKEFNNKIELLNDIIADDVKLQESFDKLCQDGVHRFAPLFVPYRNKYLKGLALKGLLPRFFSRYKLKYLRAYTSCESYHDCLLNYLNQKLNCPYE